MWRVAVNAASILTFSVYAGAAGWELISSCPTPGPKPRGYTRHEYGFVVQDSLQPYVYYLNARSGSVFSSFPAPGGSGAWGICEAGYSSEFFYISNIRTSWIYAVTEGSVVSSFLCPMEGPADLCWAGSASLFIAVPAANVFAHVDVRSGSLLRTYEGPGEYPTSCAEHPQIFAADSVTHTVYWGSKPAITDLETPTGIDCMMSITYVGPQLWIVDDATDHIYEYYYDTPVAPVSFGSIRALFK